MVNDKYDATKYSKAIATIEKADGNETVGSMWTETKSFDVAAPISDVLRWAKEKSCSGRLTLTLDQSSESTQ